jgi:hypothetical protein
MIKSATRNSVIILEVLPIPNQMIIKGIRVKDGTGLINSTIGSNRP